jgi:RNA polymerase sigma factor (sigma-70 family)
LSTAEAPSRPSRAEIEPAALDLIRRHGAQIMATARRYAVSPEDAEDAYQRGLEILLTKAPTTSPDDLVPWLKTVVKHEAFALRKQRERHGLPGEHDDTRPAPHDTHEQVERLDQLQRGAEALQRLKPHEIRCMLLLAEGHSYAEICAITGFSYTKVNRCLAEGRQSFMRRVDGIERGAECERLAPLVSAAADGEASGDDMLALRRHMRGCLACRAALRDARSVPARVAALAPLPAVVAPGPDRLHAAWHWLNERLAAFALRGQEVVEMAAAHKAVAVAASAAALAGGGAAAVHTVADREPQRRPAAAAKPVARPETSTPAPPPPAPALRTATAGLAESADTKPPRRDRSRTRADTSPQPAPQPETPPAPTPEPQPAPVVEETPPAPAPPPEPSPPPAGSPRGEFAP